MIPADSVLFKKATPKVPVDFSGRWNNELGSSMDLKVKGTAVSGTYTTAVSGGGAAITKPLVGTITDDLISFTVNWGTSITAWTGHGVYEKQSDPNKKDIPKILTLWQMVVAIPDETNPKEQWKTVYSGADTFHQ